MFGRELLLEKLPGGATGRPLIPGLDIQLWRTSGAEAITRNTQEEVPDKGACEKPEAPAWPYSSLQAFRR